MKTTTRLVVLAMLVTSQTANGFLQAPFARVSVSPEGMGRTKTSGQPHTILRSDYSAYIKDEQLPNKQERDSRKATRGGAMAATALACGALVFKKPFSLTAIPYIACLLWGLPSSMIGNRKSMISIAHRVGGIATICAPLVLALHQALTGSFPSRWLYFGTIATAAANLGFGAALICRRVPGYDIPTLRAFAVGVSLGFAFLGHSLLFVLGKFPWYRPIATLFCAISVYSAVFATSDAMQHAWNFSRGVRGISPNSQGMDSRRFWNLKFEKAKFQDVFLSNLWRQPTAEALATTVSPANGVVVFTTGMTALFASLSLLQLRYLALGTEGMAHFVALEPVFCQWSALQALLAVVANNFGTFAGTLVIQRRTSQKQAGMFNAVGLLIPVLNIVAFLALRPGSTANFGRLMMLPTV